jgi:hypothetical protein
MRSQLTRRVFRQLLSNEGLIFRCPTQFTLLSRHRPRNASPSLLRPPPRRTLFGFSSKPARQPKEPDLDPGLGKMVDLSLRDKLYARPPPATELVKAWREFFNYKHQKHEAVDNNQAGHVLRTFKYLQKANAEEEGCGLTIKDIRLARKVLAVMPRDRLDTHNQLAKLLHAECLSKGEANENERRADLRWFVDVLTQTGDSTLARNLVVENLEKDTQDSSGDTPVSGAAANRKLWPLVAAGFAKENNEVELLKTIEMAEAAGTFYNAQCHGVVTTFYAERNDVEAVKTWYSKPIVKSTGASQAPLPKTVKAILSFCIRNNELDWGKTIFRELLSGSIPPRKETWDIILQWAAGAMGKGVEDVERMMEVMVRRNPDDDSIQPDIETINGLVDLAMSRKDPYLAERYIALGLKNSIRPNAQTYILQMDYRIHANDLTGAKAAYDALQAEEILNDEDLPAINKYIRALCSAKVQDYDHIISITSDLEERHKRLEASTVAALSMMYLAREETEECADLLQTHAYHYNVPERDSIRDQFLHFILGRQNSTAKAWQAYSIMRALFDETPIEIRTQCMNEFFARGRCDMGCHAFGHMRAHTLPTRRPVLDTYIACFLGIASLEDREMLDMVHNMLKMDSTIEPNTKLYNSLMLAYTACEDADRALDFWDDITNSIEGPSYRSLEIVFWAAGRKPFGDRLAREVWRKIRGMEIEVTREVFVAYVGALAGQGKFEEARDQVEASEREFEIKVDVGM